MKTNEKGKKIIKDSEGLRLTAYRCPAGYYTIGYGHTAGVKPGDVITKKEAEDLFEKDLQKTEEDVRSLLRFELGENKFSALVSLAYNIGAVKFSKSLLLKYVNQKEFEKASKAFLLYTKAKVKNEFVSLPGLVLRREKEKELFLSI